MKMIKKTFDLTQEAKEDLKKIARFTEKQWGREQRYFYLKQFDDAFYLLAENPTLGKACDFIITGYRKFPQGSHIIFYRQATENRIIITRILHKNMDIDSRLT